MSVTCHSCQILSSQRANCTYPKPKCGPPGGNRRPADVYIPNWTRGKGSALDVTVTHSLQDATVAEAAVTPGYAAAEAYRRKMVATADDCDRKGIVFLPLAAESLGGWHPVAVQQLDKLGAALARHNAEDEHVVVRQLWQRLAVLLQRGNAALLVNRMSLFPSAAITGTNYTQRDTAH